jgi:DNA (cytosine-5)-methyltransferase 1
VTAWYNENEPYAAAWLRNLIAAGHLPAGHVDERDIRDVLPSDLAGYGQCHFFAGIGGWPLALRMAGWPDDRPVWTGSCPCQPFSSAGGRKGFADERHLWPAWFGLIRERRPSVVIGEQVSRAIGQGWLDAVSGDLEGIGYAVGAAVLPACAVDAPHRRDRLWLVADAIGRQLRDEPGRRGWPGGNGEAVARAHGAARYVADAQGERQQPRSGAGQEMGAGAAQPVEPEGRVALVSGRGAVEPWPPESGIRRVAHGIPARAPKLRALGNAVVPQLAAEFVFAYLEAGILESYF